MSTPDRQVRLASESIVWIFVPFGQFGHISGVWTSQEAAERWIGRWKASGTLKCYVLGESAAETTRRLDLWAAHSRPQPNRVTELLFCHAADEEWYEDGEKLGRDGRYPCMCCGYLTMEDPIGGSYWICPICNWEDDHMSHGWARDTGGGGPNSCDLAEARRNFDSFGACDEGARGCCRTPNLDELPRQLRPIRPQNYQIEN